MPYETARIRQEFPILGRLVHGVPLIYLDTAASAQKPKCVLDRMRDFYETEYANVHRGLHFLSTQATEAFEAAREAVRSFLGAQDTSEIIFTRNATEAINLVAQSFGGMILEEGDEVILSILEHHSNTVPWHFHRQNRGVVLRWAPVDDQGNFLLDAFARLLTPRTKMVAITQMSNALGTRVPIKDVVALAHAHGVPVLVDGSQGSVHGGVDVTDLDCDFYVMTGHKLYGPSGIGVLYGKRQHLERMPPYQGGGEMIREVTEQTVSYAELPHKFEAGTPAIAEAVGLKAALEFLDTIGPREREAHEKALIAHAEEIFGSLPGVSLVGTPEARGGIFSFLVEGIHPHDVATFLDRKGIAVRAGTHCAMPLLARFGCSATCRASFGVYTTKEEITRLGEALGECQRFFRF